MTKARSLSDFIESDGSVTLVDNQKIKVGTGNDLQIYHDGTSSYIVNTTNDLILQDDSRIRLRTPSLMVNNAADTENLLTATENGAVTLYYDNSPKLATTSTGVDVTGAITADGLTVDGSVGINASSPFSGSKLDVRGGNVILGGFGGGTDYGLILTPEDGSSYWHIYNDAGSHLIFGHDATIGSDEKMRLDSSGRLGLNENNPVYLLDVEGAAQFNNIVPTYQNGNGTSSSSNIWKLGTITLGGSTGAIITILGTRSYSAGASTGGKTEIVLRGNNATTTLDGYFYGNTQGANTVQSVFWKNTGNNNEFDIWIEYGANFAGLDHYVQTAGTWVSAVSDTGSTSQPSGSTALTSQFAVTTSGTPSLVVNSSSNTGFGTTNPTAKLDVRGSINSEHVVITGGTNSNRGLSIQTAASGGQQDAGVIFDAQDTESGANPYIQLKSAGQTVATFSKGSTDKYPTSGGLGGIGGNGANLQLDADDSEIRMANNIIHSDNSGNTKFSIRAAYGALSSDAELSLDGGHITFNAGTSFTQVGRFDTDGLKFGSDTAATNALHDYEEGTWTPQLDRQGSSSIADSYSHRSGHYIKIGGIVIARWGFRTGTVSGATSAVAQISGLPFTSKSMGSFQQAATFANTQGLSTDSDGPVLWYVHDGDTRMEARLMNNADSQMPSNYFQNNSWCIGTVIYDVSV